MAGLSNPSGLSQTSGLSIGNGESIGNGLSFQGFTPSTVSNGILQESSTTDFIMLEDGTSYLLQE
jgi:hypothetical protein